MLKQKTRTRGRIAFRIREAGLLACKSNWVTFDGPEQMPAYRSNIADAEYRASRECALDGQIVVHRLRGCVVGAEYIQRQRLKIGPVFNRSGCACRRHERKRIRLRAATSNIGVRIGKAGAKRAAHVLNTM